MKVSLKRYRGDFEYICVCSIGFGGIICDRNLTSIRSNGYNFARHRMQGTGHGMEVVCRWCH